MSAWTEARLAARGLGDTPVRTAYRGAYSLAMAYWFVRRPQTEGVFVVDKENKVQFVPVKTGVAGDKYFEVLDGLKVGDRVITGPFASVRNLADGSVEAVAEGERASVEALVAFCRRGPPAARVEAVEVTWEPPTGDVRPFSVSR